MIKAVVFDFDGTMVDSFPIVLKCANNVAKEFNFKEIKDSKYLHDKSFKKILSEDLKLPLSKLPFYNKKIKALIKKNKKNTYV